MPVPRRFDRQPPERDQTRINERIRVSEVRLVDEDGSQIGVVKTDQALAMAAERDLDLVEVAPDSRPPVARLLDYSKYKYEQEQKAKAARKHQQQVNIREIKLRPKIADHDYETKKGHVERFLRHQDKVKVTIMFRGREQAHPERGRALLERLFEDIGELATIEQHPQQEGRNMHMMLAPSRQTAAQAREERRCGRRRVRLRRRAGCRRLSADSAVPAASASIVGSDAEDEDPFGRQEALSQDRQGQAPRPARLLEPHPREEVAEAQAQLPQAGRDRRARHEEGQAAAARRGGPMSRATNAVARKRRKKKVLKQAKGYWGRKHSSYRFANEQVMRSGNYAYRDRRRRKRDMRRLWIVRINAAARREGMSYSRAHPRPRRRPGVEVNRKMLADIAVRDPEAFRRFAEQAREAVAA